VRGSADGITGQGRRRRRFCGWNPQEKNGTCRKNRGGRGKKERDGEKRDGGTWSPAIS